MSRVERIGHWLFRTRNVVFPLMVLAVLVVFPPAPIDSSVTAAFLILGLALIVMGQAVRVLTIGLDYIKRGGKNGRIYAERLVTGGVFGHSRNPMYVGNVAIASGFFLIAGDPVAVCIGIVGSYLIYAAIIRSEEGYLVREFGAPYRAYCRDVPRWLPNPRGLAATVAAFRFDWAAVVVREYGTLFTTALITLAILAVKAWRGDDLSSVASWYVALAVVLVLLYGLARYLKKSRRLRAARR